MGHELAYTDCGAKVRLSRYPCGAASCRSLVDRRLELFHLSTFRIHHRGSRGHLLLRYFATGKPLQRMGLSGDEVT